jgi:diaminopimelate epimerase
MLTVTKYDASGNDFIIFHDRNKRDRSQLAKILCDRHKGIGADGLVVLVPHKEYDFEWEFYNSDGSTALMCGNATRAVSHYAVEKGISINNSCQFLTGAGVITSEVNGDYVVTDMLPPKILQKDINEYGKNWWLIDTGVPHLVTKVEDIDKFDLNMARKLREKYDANVNIYTAEFDEMYVRTYERGVEDETLACGTGMMACYVRAKEEGDARELCVVYPKSHEELYLEYKDDVYRFGGKVTKTFIAEVTMDISLFL